jgi:hypothetical protein
MAYPRPKVIEIAQQWAESGAFSPAALLAEATVPITVKRSAQKYFMYAGMLLRGISRIAIFH